MHLSQGNVSQVDEIWLVLCRHTKQFQTVKELRSGKDESRCYGSWQRREQINESKAKRQMVNMEKE